ncbi:hypothetical protein NRB16_04145 [Pseudomonas sp. LJDD11]|uniref:hypothetical protein n=1 Tax=Pseudomonas sp. LJDD11 TaxID=2931984 RepID=UPI00211C92EA|nr:hypothetical protein [Pseudomonas sp. LJDD11]MCQ9422723.1 hypothetical protein [Pseudomonas sp. LJDD11]
MADADVQGLLVRIEATTAQLRQEVARGEASVADAADSIEDSLERVDHAFDETGENAGVLQKAVSSAFTGMGIAAGAAVAGLVAITTQATAYAQEIKNLSALSNTTVSDFQKMAAGAATVGVEQDKLADIFKDVNDRVGEFMQRGGGEMQDFFKEIAPHVSVTTDQLDSLSKATGVTIAHFASLSGPEALQLYYTSLEKAGLNQQQMTTYMEAMADEATALIPLLKNNGQGFKEIGEHAEKAGKVLNAFEVDRLVKANLAIKDLQGSLDGASRQMVIGLLPAIEDVTSRLTEMSKNGAMDIIGGAVGFLVENLNILVAVMGGKVAAAFVGYISGLAASTAATYQSRAANIAAAASAAEVALANQIAAQSAVVRAEREAIAARGTAVQTQMSIQLAQARVAERAATTQLAAAQAGLAASQGGLLALLGGPAGLAALAVGVGIAFLTMGGNAKTAGADLEALKRPISELRKEFQALNRDQKEATLVTAMRQQEQVIGEADRAFGDFLKTSREVLGSGIGTRVASEFEAARAKGEGLSGALEDLGRRFHIPEEKMRTLKESAGVFANLQVASGQAAAKVAAYREEVEASKKPADGKAEADKLAAKAVEKYTEDLDKQLTKLKDKTAVEQAGTWLTEQKISAESELGKKVLEHAKAIDKQKEADKAATDATNAAASANKKAASETQARSKALADLQAASDREVKAVDGIAAAYAAGTDKSREFTLQQKVEEALLKTGTDARVAVEKAVNAQADAQDRLNVTRAAYELQQETTDLVALAKAQLAGADALEAYNLQKSMTVALAGKNIEYGSREYEQLLKANKAQQEALKIVQQADDAGSIIDRLYPEAKALREYTAEQDALNAAMKLYPENAALYEAALVKLGAEYEVNKSKATIWGQMTEAAVDRIDGVFADAWANIGDGAESLWDNLKKGFKQTLGEIVHMLTTKPLLNSFANWLTGTDNGKGLGSTWEKILGSPNSTSGSGSGVMGFLSTAKTAVDLAKSGFVTELRTGFAQDGLTGAFRSGADYVSEAVTSAFTVGSETAAAAAQSAAQFTVESTTAGLNAAAAEYATQFGVQMEISAGAVDTALNASNAALTNTLQGLSTALSVIGIAYSIFTAYENYGVEGAAVTAGFTAAGAYIGSIVPVIGTAIGAAIGAVVGSIASSFAFGSGEKFPELSGSASGTWQGGKFTDNGWVEGWKEKQPKFGDAVNAELGATVQKFTSTMGMLYSVFGDSDASISLDNTMRQRKTSGDYSSAFLATLNNGQTITGIQQHAGGDVVEGIKQNYEYVMGSLLAQAIVNSDGIPAYFKNQFMGFARDWESSADDVIAAIEGVFTRFNGVNSALKQIRVGVLEIGDVGLQASDAILNMVAKFSDLDVDTASAKEKVNALNELVNGYYQAFFSEGERFQDLEKTLRGTFLGFNMEFPDTREAYRKIVEDIDVTTIAGQSMFATMMGLATSADAYFSTLEEGASNYYDLFTTDSQKSLDQIAATRAAFTALGVELPATRDAFVSMVEAAKKGQVTGKATADALMALATSADTAYQALQGQLVGNANAAFAAVQRSINAQKTSINDMITTARESASGLTSISTALSNALKALRGDGDDAVRMLRDQAKATVVSALAIAKAGGSLSKFEGLEDALSVISDNDTSLYSSLEDFNREQGRNANLIAELNGLNGKQLSASEKTIKALEDQLVGLDKQLEFAQAQMDALNGVDTSVKTVADAIKEMNAAVVAAIGTISGKITAQNAGTLVDSIYQDKLGRPADAGGKQYWVDQMTGGSLNAGNITGAITNAAAIEAAYKAAGIAMNDGASYWATQLTTGAMTPAQLQEAVRNAAIANGSIRGYATGGLIAGPGTGTSDSILARLSNGEYVMSADAVRMFGTGLLDQMNDGRLPGFATGGGINVGETGPVLQITRPAQIYSQPQRGTEQGGNTAALERKVDMLIDVVKQIVGPMKVNSDENSKLMKKWDRVGLPTKPVKEEA